MGIVFKNVTGSQEMKDNGCADFIFNMGSLQLTLNIPSTWTTVLDSGKNLSINATTSLPENFILKANSTIID